MSAEESPPAAERNLNRLGMAAILVTVAAIASLTGWRKSLWMDEYFTLLECIGHVPYILPVPIGQVFDSSAIWADNDLKGVRTALLTGDNGNMSAYIFLTHFLVRAFGTGWPFALVVPTILAHVVSVYWCFRLGRMLYSDRVGLLAAFLCAIHKSMLIFAIELRTYAPAVALSLIATECFIRIVGLDRNANEPAGASSSSLRFWSLLYMVTTLAALFFHFLSAIVIAGHVLYAVLMVRSLRQWAYLAVSGAIVLLVFLSVRGIWLSSEGYGVVDAYAAYTHRIGRYPFKPASLKGIVFVIGSGMYIRSGLLELPRATASSLYPTALMGLAVLLPRTRTALFSRKPQLVLVFIGAFLLLFAAGVSLFLNFATFPNAPRYQIFAVPFFAILMAVVLDSFLSAAVSEPGGRKRIFSGIAAAYLALVMLTPTFVVSDWFRHPPRNDHLTWAGVIGDRAAEGTLEQVAVPCVLDAQMLAFYLGPERSVRFVVEDVRRAEEIDRRLRSMGLWHPLSLFTETVDDYKADGADPSRLVAESDSGGVLRLRYGKRP